MNSLSDHNIYSRKTYFAVLILGMISSVVLFNTGYQVIAAGTIILSVTLLWLITNNSERPIFDERDNSLAEESTHTAVMLSGALLGVVMIFISVGIGLNYIEYPDWIAPYYISWGIIIGLTIVIETLKRYNVINR